MPPRAKIANADILPIYLSDAPTEELAKLHDVDTSTITRIRNARHSLTQHLPPRKCNGSAYFTEARRAKIGASYRARTERRASPRPFTRPDIRGERHPMSKLSNADAIAIFHSSDTIDQLAHLYNVCNRSIRNIKAGRHWATKHLAA